GREGVDGGDPRPGNELAGGRIIRFDLMVQCADNVPVVARGRVHRAKDDVISLRIGDMPAVGNRLEVRVRDVEEEGIVRQGGSPGADLLVIDRDLLPVSEGQGWCRPDLDGPRAPARTRVDRDALSAP